ncbi:glycosyltransferase [Bifidobacterium samirii]|uniref:Capsular polysaccharide biosynthesis protein n=1 Tax=Bifidobacterium samirii TaxID=2306974 RepID=A0A430FU56_9BIFI|nr:glycosyltransferase [Bifidobacterium samirii]RSX56689.1 capsular polysaccharide biosynthesis protein [Bifidobacterium samirii]
MDGTAYDGPRRRESDGETGRLRIAVCAYLWNWGGSDIASIRIARLLQAQGHDVTLLVPDSGSLVEAMIPEGLETFRFGADNRFARLCGAFRLTAADRTPLLRVARKILHLCSGRRRYLPYDYAVRHLTGLPEREFDVVLDTEGYGHVNTALCARLACARRATWVHSVELDWMKGAYPYLRDFDRIYCVSETVRRGFDARYPELSDRTQVLYNPVDEAEIRDLALRPPTLYDPAGDGLLRIITVSRLSWEKNLGAVIDIATRLRARGLRFRWDILGDGEERETLRRRIAQEGLDDVCMLRGTTPNPFPYVRAADLYVQTSIREGYGLGVQEARILGVPCVVSDIAAFREQIRDGETGYLCADVDAFVERMAELAAHPERRRAMSERLGREPAVDDASQRRLLSFVNGEEHDER